MERPVKLQLISNGLQDLFAKYLDTVDVMYHKNMKE